MKLVLPNPSRFTTVVRRQGNGFAKNVQSAEPFVCKKRAFRRPFVTGRACVLSFINEGISPPCTVMTPRDRLFIMHAACCVAAVCFSGFQYQYQLVVPRVSAAKSCLDFVTVVFACETMWLLNFFHCVTADRTSIFPVGFSSKAVTYGSALAAATLSVLSAGSAVGMQVHHPATASCALACCAACVYSAVARMVHGRDRRNAAAEILIDGRISLGVGVRA